MSGEHPNGRKAMDDLIRRQVEAGIPARKAQEQARQTAIRHDQQQKK